MVDHAFEPLGLHRVALSVFAFNERAIRAYRRVGFVIEGRAREAIWRDGRWWDELHMSVLEPEWRRRAGRTRAAADGRGGPRPADEVAAAERLAGRLTMASTGPGRGRGPGGVPGADGGAGPRRGERPAGRRRARAAFASGALVQTPALDQMLGDLALALEQDEGQKLGGKSAEAARFILRAIGRELDNA